MKNILVEKGSLRNRNQRTKKNCSKDRRLQATNKSLYK